MANAESSPRRRRKRLPVWAVPVLIVATLAAAELMAGFIGPWIPRTAGTEERLLIKSDQVFSRGSGVTDVVVLGSSESAGGAIPASIENELTGLDGVYNAALAGSESTVMTQWADRVVVPNLDPKVAVIGILPMTVMTIDQAGADNPLAAIEAYESAIDQVDPGGLGSWGWRIRQESDLIRYRPYLRSPVAAAEGFWRALGNRDDEPPPEPGLDWTTETNPERVAEATAPDGEVYDYRQPSLPLGPEGDPIGAAIYTRFSEADTNFDGLDSLVTSLRAQGVTPVVAIAPVDRAPLLAAGADLSALDAVAAEVQAWGESNDVEVNDQFTQDWEPSLFHDRNHLAEPGAEAWSAELGRWLSQLCADDRLGNACGG